MTTVFFSHSRTSGSVWVASWYASSMLHSEPEGSLPCTLMLSQTMAGPATALSPFWVGAAPARRRLFKRICSNCAMFSGDEK